MKQKHIVILGCEGQLGRSLVHLGLDEHLHPIPSNILLYDDLESRIKFVVERAKGERVFVINCAAVSNVDECEQYPAKAFLTNAYAVGALAEICRNQHATLIHISSNFVFGNEEGLIFNASVSNATYAGPLNTYGYVKSLAEELIEGEIDGCYIVRTSWLFSRFGKFLPSIVNRIRNNEEVKATDKIVSVPTSTYSLSNYLYALIGEIVKEQQPVSRIQHFVNSGQASQLEYFYEIVKDADSTGMLSLSVASPVITAVSYEEMYKNKAQRPRTSVLSTAGCFTINTIPWHAALYIEMKALAERKSKAAFFRVD